MARQHRDRFVAVVACTLASMSCKSHREQVAPAGTELVPKTRTAITLDGEIGETDWDRHAVRNVFLTNGAESRPFSEIRMLHDRDRLYVLLYAADEDVHSSEAFEVSIGKIAFHVSPKGDLTPQIADVHLGVDLDGTLDNTSDDDEEWVVELSIPLSSIDFAKGSVPVHVGRCDTPRSGELRCGAWNGAIALGEN